MRASTGLATPRAYCCCWGALFERITQAAEAPRQQKLALQQPSRSFGSPPPPAVLSVSFKGGCRRNSAATVDDRRVAAAGRRRFDQLRCGLLTLLHPRSGRRVDTL